MSYDDDIMVTIRWRNDGMMDDGMLRWYMANDRTMDRLRCMRHHTA